jgi:GT2 family glycosyltransferase
VFDEIGEFDDDFDLYYGDTDLCLSAINRGYRVVYTPYAVLLHQGSTTIKENSSAYFAVENHQHFIKKWPYLRNGDPFYNPNLGWDYRIAVN